MKPQDIFKPFRLTAHQAFSIRHIAGLILGTALMASGAAVIAASAGEARTETAGTAQIDILYKNPSTIYDIDAEGRITNTVSTSRQILHERALESEQTISISYSRGVQEAEILEACTLKADGRRIEASADNYQTKIWDGREYQETITVIFPDVAVGDSVSIRYRIRDKVAIFPNAVSFSYVFYPFAIEEGNIIVRFPKDMALTLESYQLEELPAATSEGIVTRQWRYQNPIPRVLDEAKDNGIWRTGDLPLLVVSSFPDYEAIAKAYGERALPKAEPTERLRELAAQIAGNEKAPREQARLIYEWVSTQISYAGNSIDVGSVVPRDLELVLDNKMGNCKDQATLLQALLAARNIASEQVLIASGYDLPKAPLVWAVDHVMNYLPEWKLYVDATARNIPFGYLPRGFHGKPVIHVGVPDAVRTLAANKGALSQQRIQTTLKLAANGSASGTMRIYVKGTAAVARRSYLMDMKPEQREKFVERSLSRLGLRGKGALALGELSAGKRLSDELEFGANFQIDNFLRSTSGAFVLDPLLSASATISSRVDVDDSLELTRDQACGNSEISEIYDITLEPGVRFTQLPEPLTRKTSYIDFKSTVKRTRNGIRVERSFIDKTSPGICSAVFQNAWNKEAAIIMENLQQQVFYKRNKSR